MSYYQKYLKYKAKYLELKNQLGGGDEENLDFFLNFNTIGKNIIDKYQNFSNLDLMLSPIKPIGAGSANGFINLIKYKNLIDSKIFDTVVKTSREKNADNNFYEFNVGRCINIIKQYYPNFIYTFLYFNLSPTLKSIIEPKGELKRVQYTNMEFFKKNIEHIKVATKPSNVEQSDIESGCSNNDRASVLIENIPNGISFDELIIDPDFNIDYNYNIFSVLFQIYSVLWALKEIYTHYDLHSGNVMFVKSPNTIKIVYNIIGMEYQIFTRFIPVILDYGRSYINCSKLDSTLITSETYAEKACNSNCNSSTDTHTCKNNSLKFYKYNDKWFDNSNFYFINPRVKNESFDLRFINSIMTQNILNCDIKQKYLKKFNIQNNPDWFDPTTKYVTYGVKEHPRETDKIVRLSDLMVFLISYYNNSNFSTSVPIVKNINEINEVINIDCDINKKIKWSHTNSRQTAKDLGEMPPIQPLKVNPIKQVLPVMPVAETLEAVQVAPEKVAPKQAETLEVVQVPEQADALVAAQRADARAGEARAALADARAKVNAQAARVAEAQAVAQASEAAAARAVAQVAEARAAARAAEQVAKARATAQAAEARAATVEAPRRSVEEAAQVKEKIDITMKEWNDLVDTAESWRKEAIKCDPSLA